jgi:hypothetical protein
MAVIEGEVQEPKAVAKRAAKPVIVNGTGHAEDPWLAMVKELAPTIGVEGVRELIVMRREERALQAEQQYNAAMAKTQSRMQAVTKNKRNDQTSSNYADLAAIIGSAVKIANEDGFGVICSEFKSDRENHIGVACKVVHAGGHSERHEFHIPFDAAGLKGNVNKTPTHAYGSTISYGRRYAIACVFNIATEDDDGNAAGGKAKRQEVAAVKISAKEAIELSELIQKTPEPAAAGQTILMYFRVDSIEQLTQAQFVKARAQLKQRFGL